MDVIAGTCPRWACLVSRDVRRGLDAQFRHGGAQISGDLGRQSKGPGATCLPYAQDPSHAGAGFSSVSSVPTFHPSA